MSSILKALKRLEKQKAVRRNALHDMEWVGSDPDRRAGEKRRWPMVAALLSVALFSVLSTYWFTRVSNKMAPVSSSISPISPPPSKPEVSPGSTPGVVSPAPESATGPAVPPVAPWRTPAPAAPAAEPVPSRPVVRGIPADEGEGDLPEAAPAPARREPPAAPARKAPAAVPPVVPEHPAPPAPSAPSQLPRLSVTGIAWQKDGQVRIAVVNGRSVTEGSLVDGALVEKITPDRVSFSYRDRTFDVPLGESSDDR